MSEYFYPIDLMDDDKYKFRRVTIKVYKNKVSQAAQDLYNSVVDKMDFLKDTKKSDKEPSTEEMKQNYETSDKQQGELLSMIGLPLPNTFTDSQQHKWGVEEGPIGGKLRQLENANIGDAVSAILPKKGGIVSKLISKGTDGMTFSNVAGSISSKTGLRKPLADPGYFQNYTGTEPRDFSMSFDFVPKNQKEAKQMIDIIMALKRYSSPSRSSMVSLLAPFFFKIHISNKELTSMIAINTVVLKNISLDYGADGNMQQTFDGIPKHVKMDLTFGEKEFKTMEDWTTKPKPKKQKARDRRLSIGGGF